MAYVKSYLADVNMKDDPNHLSIPSDMVFARCDLLSGIVLERTIVVSANAVISNRGG